MSKKTLKINCETCDVRGITKEILDAYKNIRINTEWLINSKSAAALMADYNVDIRAENIMSLPDGQTIAFKSVNGKCRLTKNMFSTPTCMTVNGVVEVDKDAFEGENQLLGITVNGVISYPDTVTGSLPPMTINGLTEVYPGDCTRLPQTAVIDRLFVLRARASRYFSRKRVLMLDTSADIAKLVEKKIEFLTGKAYIAASLLEDAVSLFDESTDLVELPDGTVYLSDCTAITADTLRRHGGKLLLTDDVRITGLDPDDLAKLESLYVSGTVYADEAAAERLYAIGLSPETKLFLLRGDMIADRGDYFLSKAQLDDSRALDICNCGQVKLDADMDSDTIREKLTLRGCGMVVCTPEQRAAVELCASGCGKIVDSSTQADDADDSTASDSEEMSDTQVICAEEYRF